MAGPWTLFVQDKDILFASPLQEESSKSQGCEEKEKLEKEQDFVDSGSGSFIYPVGVINYASHSYYHIPYHHKEPVSP
ncbi:MAG TPA: hypothetical protein VEA37_10900, partial [Flavobacterium sp.]|nr:hypothetical protein [Flavobacterium sp.]